MAEELAAARTLLVEFRGSIDAHSADLVHGFLQTVQAYVYKRTIPVIDQLFRVPEESRGEDPRSHRVAKEILKDFPLDLATIYEDFFGEISHLTPEQARTMAQLLQNVAKLAESFKKMVDGATLHVNYDQQVVEMVGKFLTMVVFPYCTTEQRDIIGEQALKFLPLPEESVVEVDAHG